MLAKSKTSRLASFYILAGRFESYLVALPEDRFSRDVAQLYINFCEKSLGKLLLFLLSFEEGEAQAWMAQLICISGHTQWGGFYKASGPVAEGDTPQWQEPYRPHLRCRI